MSQQASYERMVMSLGEACRDAAEMGDREIETQLRNVLAIAIDRLYASLDESAAQESGATLPRH